MTADREAPDQFRPVGHRLVVGQRAGAEHLGQLRHHVSVADRRGGEHTLHGGSRQHPAEGISAPPGAEKRDRVYDVRMTYREFLGDHCAQGGSDDDTRAQSEPADKACGIRREIGQPVRARRYRRGRGAPVVGDDGLKTGRYDSGDLMRQPYVGSRARGRKEQDRESRAVDAIGQLDGGCAACHANEHI